jgi:uncharacterized cupredoxin-like copper-binding protein
MSVSLAGRSTRTSTNVDARFFEEARDGDGLAPGSTGWVTLTLKPGRYELVCDEPWHYAAGMFDVFTVG